MQNQQKHKLQVQQSQDLKLMKLLQFQDKSKQMSRKSGQQEEQKVRNILENEENQVIDAIFLSQNDEALDFGQFLKQIQTKDTGQTQNYETKVESVPFQTDFISNKFQESNKQLNNPCLDQPSNGDDNIQQIQGLSSISNIEQNLQNTSPNESLELKTKDRKTSDQPEDCRKIQENIFGCKCGSQQQQEKQLSQDMQENKFEQQQIPSNAGYGSFLKEMEIWGKDASFEDQAYDIWNQDPLEERVTNLGNQLEIKVNGKQPQKQQYLKQIFNDETAIQVSKQYIIDFKQVQRSKIELHTNPNTTKQLIELIKFIESRSIINNYSTDSPENVQIQTINFHQNKELLSQYQQKLKDFLQFGKKIKFNYLKRQNNKVSQYQDFLQLS